MDDYEIVLTMTTVRGGTSVCDNLYFNPSSVSATLTTNMQLSSIVYTNASIGKLVATGNSIDTIRFSNTGRVVCALFFLLSTCPISILVCPSSPLPSFFRSVF